jgi:hypothetical protein
MLSAAKINRPMVPSLAASDRRGAIGDFLFKCLYLTAAVVATLGWIWLLAWSSMHLLA